jgi:WS/DGAT/MGAT family acyltransferase
MGNETDPADIVALMALEGQVDEARFRATIEQRLLTHRRFRRRVVESAHKVLPPHWQDEQPFSLDAHLIRRRLAPPGGDRELAALLADIANEPIDFSSSPWRIFVVEGSPAGSILVTQIHHCMGDGFALVGILMSLADDDSQGGPSPLAPEREAHGHLLSDTVQAARRVEHGIADFGHLLFLPFDPKTPLRSKPMGERRLAWSNGIPLSRVKALAHARSATINDVLVAALAGALRRYLEDHGSPTPTFRAIVPVNLRPLSEPLDEEHGNRFGLVFADLPVGVADREARLAQVKRTMNRIKASEEPIVSLAVLNVLGRSPAVVEHVFQEVFARKGSIVVTNVPGPRAAVSLAGRRIRDMMFWAPHPAGLSCGASILSYAGTVRVGVRSDVGAVADPELIARHFDDELLDWPDSPPGRAP